MIKGETNSGFKYSIEEKRLYNYQLLEVIGEIDENPVVAPKALNLLLGKEQAAALKEHVRDEDGIVPAAKMVEELGNIFQNQDQTKNS